MATEKGDSEDEAFEVCVELSWEGTSGSGEIASSGDEGQFWDRAAGQGGTVPPAPGNLRESMGPGLSCIIRPS